MIRKDRPQAKEQNTGVIKEDIKLVFLWCFWVVLVSTPSVLGFLFFELLSNQKHNQ